MIRATLFATVLSTAALIAPAAPALAASTAAAGDAPAAQLNKEDREFFDAAAQGGLLEVKLGQLVVKQGQSDDVKRFAQRMIDDHTKLDQRLAEVGKADGLTAPQELDKKHQETLDRLAQLSGSKLDQEYISQMVSDHKDDVKAFEKAAKETKDPALKQLAASALPTLNEHLTLAKQINERINKK